MTDQAPPTTAVYAGLTPDVLLSAVDRCGFQTSGRFLALNSYENRVYQIGLDDGDPLIAKFYRPGRWSDDAILEEHAFALELAAQEIPVVPPLVIGEITLHRHAGYRYALYARQGGHWPELNHREERLWMGRFIARIHAVGASRSFKHRPTLDIGSFGYQSSSFLLEHGFLPAHTATAYRTLTKDLLQQVETCFRNAGNVAAIRLHGDCHPGNILWTEQGPHFVDLDDCRTGPAIQDLWMLLSGERHDMQLQLSEILEGYRQFYEFNYRELQLVEALRTLRMIHYSAWLARRWEDPAFPLAFPWFNTARYWEDHILALREQASLMNEPLLEV
ncbi:MAG: serine/threonine protein kinase [Gammaproteobacteria bacterium]|nr:MAG: serine/threonine protein kinase [Gammaproteobacteria bacterium]